MIGWDDNVIIVPFDILFGCLTFRVDLVQFEVFIDIPGTFFNYLFVPYRTVFWFGFVVWKDSH